MAGINTYLNNLAAGRDLFMAMWGQSNCSGPGLQAEFASIYTNPIPNTRILYNGAVSQLQIGVNNKIAPAATGGYELTVSYNYQNDTGENIYIAKVDYGGTQIYQDAGSASVSSVAIGTGSKTFTIGTGLTYASADKLIAYKDASNYMRGICSSYDSGTGVIVMNSITTVGSGTYNSWTVGKLDWNISSSKEYYNEYIEAIYDLVDYCLPNNIVFKMVLFGIHGEEDGLDTTKANAYEVNLKAFLRKAISDIHVYINANYPGTIIPHIKALVARTKSNSGAGGITIRTAQDNTVASNPHYAIIPITNVILGGDNVHITAQGFVDVAVLDAVPTIKDFWT